MGLYKQVSILGTLLMTTHSKHPTFLEGFIGFFAVRWPLSMSLNLKTF